MAKKVNIIGAGLAGLSSGIYLQESGINTEIFELADWAGGMCTAWVRKGYRFDGCIHWMVGTKIGDEFYKLYREVDALKKDTIIYNAKAIKIEAGGVMYDIPLNISEFKAFLHSLSPQDTIKINKFCKDIEIMINTKMPAGSPSNLFDLIKIMKQSKGFIPLALKYNNMTVEEYVKSFQSHTIRSILHTLMPMEFSAIALIMMLGTRMSDNAGYPMGGALDLIERMETKYKSLGGKINFHSKVDKIIIENGKASGIQTNGTFYTADAVIAACDAYDILKNMLGGKYRHPQLDNMLESAPLFPGLSLVSFGLNRRFDIPFSINYECPEGIKTGPDFISDSFSIRSFDFDPSAAPKNCSSVMASFTAPIEYWNNLRHNDINEYKKQKQQLANAAADAIEKRFPGFKDAIEVVDVATPATYSRIANLYKSSFEGFAPTPTALKTNIRKTIPGIKGLFICGQWTSAGGGICTAISSGKEAANSALKAVKIMDGGAK